MNYNYLRYFSVLAQVEHYTLAAARLGISQPSLSSAIHHLEAELGDVQLFEKVGRNIRLTEEGKKATYELRERIKMAVEKGGDGLSDEEREHFYYALQVIAKNLQDISREGL